jgi:hypothetical protein
LQSVARRAKFVVFGSVFIVSDVAADSGVLTPYAQALAPRRARDKATKIALDHLPYFGEQESFDGKY